MKQYVRIFSNQYNNIDIQINDYLEEHPNYVIYEISFYCDKALVVFNVTDPPTHSVARGITF